MGDLQTTCYLISQNSFQRRFCGQYFFKEMTKQLLQSIVFCYVILNHKETKLLKFSDAGAGTFNHKSVFLHEETRI